MIRIPTSNIRCAFRIIYHLNSWNSCVQCRNFAIKELSWCSKSSRPLKHESIPDVIVAKKPIDRFGIVAAMSENHIIGLKGRLPWNIPADRKEFVELTRDKILIIGRKTLEEQPTLTHISHAAKCIVISNTLQHEDAARLSKLTSNTEVLVVPAFPDALDLARRMTSTSTGSETTTKTTIEDTECWVAGGEGIYNMAILHPSAWWLHLTVVNMHVDDKLYPMSDIARFPPKYHWDRRFTQRSAIEQVGMDDGNEVKFTKYIYSKRTAVQI